MSRFGSDSLTMALSSCATADICVAKAMLQLTFTPVSIPFAASATPPWMTPGPSEASLPLFCTGIFVNYAGSLDSEQLCCSVRGGDNLGGAQQHTLEQPCGNPVPLAPARCGRGARRRPAEVRVCTERACAVVSCQ